MGSTMGRYHDVAQYINETMFGGGNIPDTPSKVERIALVIPSVLSGVDNALKGFYAVRMGQTITQFGDNRIKMSWPEAVLKGLLGVSTNKEEDYRRLQGLSDKGIVFGRSEAEKVAAIIWKAQVKNLKFFEGTGKWDMNRAIAMAEGERAIYNLLKPHEQEMVKQKFLEIVLRRRGTEQDIFMRLWKLMQDTAITPEVLQRAVRSNLLFDDYPREQEQMLGMLEQMLEGQDERMQWYKDQNLKFDDELNFLLDRQD